MSYDHTVKFFETKQNFTYVSDGKKDTWTLYKEKGPFSGDCEDFAITLAYRMFKGFWWPLLRGKFSLFFVLYNGGGHMVLKVDDTWYDNIMKNPTQGNLPKEYQVVKRHSVFSTVINFFLWKR